MIKKNSIQPLREGKYWWQGQDISKFYTFEFSTEKYYKWILWVSLPENLIKRYFLKKDL